MTKSLHEEHGKDAVEVLQGKMKSGIVMPDGFTVTDNGNHYIISKGSKEMKVGLYCAKEVFKALDLFT